MKTVVMMMVVDGGTCQCLGYSEDKFSEDYGCDGYSIVFYM